MRLVNWLECIRANSNIRLSKRLNWKQAKIHTAKWAQKIQTKNTQKWIKCLRKIEQNVQYLNTYKKQCPFKSFN